MSVATPGNALDVARTLFDNLKQVDEAGEWWSARDLMPLYGYAAWHNFKKTIDQAKLACAKSAADVTSNFNDTVKIDKFRKRKEDFRLSRYAAYLVAMEGDASKTQIATAKTYFAVQTRRAEVLLDGALSDPEDPEHVYDVMARQVEQLRQLHRNQRILAMRQDATDGRVTELEKERAELAQVRAELVTVTQEREETKRQLGELMNRVENVEHVTPLKDRTRLHTTKEVAQLLGFGLVTFYEVLREMGIVYREGIDGHKIYQKYLDAGWGEARWIEWANGKGHSWAPLWTAKAVIEIKRRIEEADREGKLF